MGRDRTRDGPGVLLPRNGIIAGRSQSTTFARILMYNMLKFLWDGYQTSQAYGLSACPDGENTASVSSSVDDLKTTTQGQNDTHVDTHQIMGSNMILELKGMKAKVSKKNVTLSTKRKNGLDLAKHYAKKGVSTSVKPFAKYLGLGMTGGAKRTGHHQRAHQEIATKKSNSPLAKQEKQKARALYTTWFYPRRRLAWREKVSPLGCAHCAPWQLTTWAAAKWAAAPLLRLLLRKVSNATHMSEVRRN